MFFAYFSKCVGFKHSNIETYEFLNVMEDLKLAPVLKHGPNLSIT